MIDDVLPPTRRKPKVIEPLAKPAFKPLPRLEMTAAPDSHEPEFASGSAPDSKHPDTAEAIPAAGKTGTTGSTPPQPPKRRFHVSWPPSRRQSIVLSVIAVLLAFGSGAAWTHFHRTVEVSAVSVKPSAKKPKVVVPTTVPSTLSGLPVDPAVNQRPVTAVMIENSIDARPQSGLDQAGVVFEAIAEGGVTRFMALYQDTQPDYIGPVRSARPYYLAWALGFDAGYAHVGGSPDGLADIKAWGVRDLDQFYNSGAYQRISSRYAPHNVYTSIAKLNAVEQAKGYTTSTFTGFARKADQPYKPPTATKPTAGKKTPTSVASDIRTAANSIDMTLSGYYYNPHFDYDATTNTYKRSEEGKPHMELSASGAQTQIAPKVVIGLVVPLSQGALDSSGAFYSNYNPIGSGQAYVFQDGTVTIGTWTKTDNKSQLSFTDSSGATIKLDAGQTWLTAVSATNQVTYRP